MCGIFAYIGTRDDAPSVVFEGIKLLEYRGYDSWGVSYIPNIKSKKIMFEKHSGKIGDSFLKTTIKSKIALGHTRWATHGGVSDENAHPHLDCKGEIAVIHNGIVENYQELKVKLSKNNHIYKSETDTEVISHLIEDRLKTSDIKTSVFDTFESLIGSNAICVLDLKTESVVACRNGSPIVVGFDEKGKQYFLASDVPAFLKYTNKVHFLEDGEGVVVSKSGIKIFDIKSKKEIKAKIKKLDWQLEDAEKGGYPYFLVKEINEQPKTILKSSLINKDELDKVSRLIKKSKKIVLIGCGTASYAALAGKYFFSNSNIQSENYGAYEFLPFAKFCNKDTVVIAISQSGETADTLIAIKEAKKYGAKVVTIVNARGTTMERISDIILPIGAGPEIAVVSTKAMTAQFTILYLLSKTVENKYNFAINSIENLSKKLKLWMNQKLFDEIIKLVKEIDMQEHMYVIGKNLNYPGALEFGLKIKETSYIHAESFTAGELKHGVITLIQKDTPCFILASNDIVKNEVLSSAAELKARGGYIIGVAPFESSEFDATILTPDLEDLTIFGNIIVGQLLGYYLGIGRGADPDKPRNLAKSVTVK
ncbi:MAG: glutamine--fructose-6-phosphate transaminase (isomerizing) [Candidatus Woesebacteria bacterium]|nr:glutamine--fructose-6-phosphate transaminase (isomerizing) [Candidatus Woesebacteria bacterium]